MIQEPVKKYLDRLSNLIEARQYRFSQDELMAIAWEAGMTEIEFVQMREEIFFYLERASLYIEMKKWEDALSEIESAHTLDPLNPYTLWHKAYLYTVRWKEEKNGAWKALAQEVLNKCLQLDPSHQPSLGLLQEMTQWKRKQKEFATSKAFISIAFVLFILCVFAVFQYSDLLLKQPTRMAQYKENYEVAALCAIPSHLVGVDMKIGAVSISHPASNNAYTRIQYEYSGNISCDSLELGRMLCQVLFKDSEGLVIASESFPLLDAINQDQSYNHRLSMHPNDMFSFERSNTWGIPVAPKYQRKVASVEFSLVGVQAQLTDNQFSAYPKISLPWAKKRPYYLRFNAYHRLDTLLLNPYDSLVTHHSQIAIKNEGNKDCKYLQIQLEWQDTKGQLLQEKTISVLDTHMIALKPNQTILVSCFAFFKYPEYVYPEPFHQIRAKVLEAY